MKQLLLFTFLASLLSCSQSKFVVAPSFTSVEKISKISQGQDVSQVNAILGIQPYDVLYLNNQDFLCYYNYRLLERKMNIDNSSKNRKINKDKHLSSEQSQTFGVPFYTDWKKLYVSFKDGALTHYISDAGMESANYIQLVNGTVSLLNKEDILKLLNFYEVGEESLDVDKLLFQLDRKGGFNKANKSKKTIIHKITNRQNKIKK